jgi:HSP20 family protein
MSENTTNQSRQYLLSILVIALIAFAGFQTWYMMDMKHKLDAISSGGQASSEKTTDTIAQNNSVIKQNKIDIPEPANQQGQSKKNAPQIAQNDNFFNHPFAGGNWNPYAEIERMQRDMDRIFNNAFNGVDSAPLFQSMFDNTTALPQMNVEEDGSKYTITLDLPGADKNNLSVNLDGQRLTVSGEQNMDQQKQDANGNVIFQERHSGKFNRSITLPDPVRQNSLVTHVDNGVLTITVNKLG